LKEFTNTEPQVDKAQEGLIEALIRIESERLREKLREIYSKPFNSSRSVKVDFVVTVEQN